MERIDRLPDLNSICFAYPQKTKPVSVTGKQCELNCAHCGGHYLQHMQPLTAAATADSSLSWLVSGGCRADGSVPVGEHLDKLAAIKNGRRYNMHVGLVGEADIDKLAAVADCVSFDFVGDDTTIQEVFGNGRTAEDYIKCYQSLRRKVRVMPHICVGLKGGEICGEYRALELLQELGAEAVTLIIFMPTRGTRFADRKPPAITEVARLMAYTRLNFPDTPVNLGCMRPGGRYREEIDKWAVRIGFNSIVNPAPAAVELANRLGLTITRGEECCVL
ncbi:radical SAM protein [Sporomusa sp.]|uniref:radical SAM protein n=1 Tax=Sporomusa sp. TaxID=2078658 RepID=UPI002B90D3CE|nr:radical SAM protein [Sporomusa sp.]HWR09112.1 radical SAM protein [Sporomusa sp.]